MKRILPFDTNVELKSYPYYSNYLSILKSKNIPINMELFCKTYELKYVFLKGQVKGKENDYFKNKFEIAEFQLPMQDLITYICNAIDNNKYVCIVLNFRGIKISNKGYTNNDFHTWLIYGYDNSKKIFYMAGYLSKIGFPYYNSFNVSFEEVINSQPNMNEITGYEKNLMDNHLISLNTYNVKNVSKEEILNYIKRYNKVQQNIFSNRNTYKWLIIHIKLGNAINKTLNDRNLLDCRDYITIKEHFLSLNKMMKALNIELFNDKIVELLNIADAMVLLSVKYSLDKKRKNKICNSMCKQLKIIMKKEKLLYCDLKNYYESYQF